MLTAINFSQREKKLKFGLEICLVLRVLRRILITRKDFLKKLSFTHLFLALQMVYL